MINDHKTAMKVHLPYKITDAETKFGEWKIQLKMWINCVSFKNFEDTRTIHSVSNNIEILMGSETDDIIDELFKSLLQRYQNAREESTNKGRELNSWKCWFIVLLSL